MGLKKIIKKVGKGVKKAAPLIMAGLAAKALMGRRRPRGGFLKSGAAGGASLRPPMPSHLGETVHTRPERYGAVPDRITNVASGAKSGPNTWRDYIPWKKGGRVTGIAKRGFGRALMKGKK